MNDKSSLSISELKKVLDSLKEQKEAINNTKVTVDKVLESSASCFAVSGLDYSAISNSFNTTFKSLDNRFDALINALENGVIKNYSELISIIRKVFNKSLADKISSLLEI